VLSSSHQVEEVGFTRHGSEVGMRSNKGRALQQGHGNHLVHRGVNTEMLDFYAKSCVVPQVRQGRWVGPLLLYDVLDKPFADRS
jgi:hypothetical protein